MQEIQTPYRHEFLGPGAWLVLVFLIMAFIGYVLFVSLSY